MENTHTNVSQTVLPESKFIARRFYVTNTEIVTNLPLQMSLYFNVIYSFIFIPLQIGVFIWKTSNMGLSSTESMVSVIAFLFLVITEPTRLYFGYTGNLREKVPYLGGFFLLSIIPQLLITIYLLFIQTRVPFDFAVNLITLLFLLVEIPLSYWVIKKMIRSQTTSFYLQNWNFDDDL